MDVILLSKKRLVAPYGATFRNISSGNWDNPYIWEFTTDNFITTTPSGRKPKETDTVYLSQNTEVILTKNENCYNLFINGNNDTKRLTTGIFELGVFGDITSFTGVAPGVIDSTSTGAGIQGYISNSRITIKGTTRNMFENLTGNSDARGVYLKIELASQSEEITLIKYFPFGWLELARGIVRNALVSGNYVTNPIRLRGDEYTNTGQSKGYCILRSGTVLETAALDGGNTIGSSAMISLIVEEGATVIGTVHQILIGTKSYSFLGKIQVGYLKAGTTQDLYVYPPRVNDGTTPGQALSFEFHDLEILVKMDPANPTGRLFRNPTVAPYHPIILGKLTIIKEYQPLKAAGIFDSAYYCKYDSSVAQLIYKDCGEVISSDYEFNPSSLMGEMPYQLVVDNCILTLNGNKNIHGGVVLLNGGSINYNGFTINII